MAIRKAHTITLHLADIQHFFEKPTISPLTDCYWEHSYTSGIEYIAKELYAKNVASDAKIVLILPPKNLTDDLEIKLKAAVRRYCRSRIKAIEQETNGLRGRAIQALFLALVGLVICIELGSQLLANNSFLIQTIGQSLIVLGWIFIWFPVDAIAFGVWQYHLDKQIYEHLMDMPLTLQSSDPRCQHC